MKDELRKPGKRTPRLFDRVAAILEEARTSVVRTVNTRMVIAYWLIGREIVQAEQGGRPRAGYGDTLLEDLSRRLTARYGRGYSAANLKNFRQFHLVYTDRHPAIHHEARGELQSAANEPAAIRYLSSSELPGAETRKSAPVETPMSEFAACHDLVALRLRPATVMDALQTPDAC